MTLAERLRLIANQIGESVTIDDEGEMRNAMATIYNELRALADYVDGRVVVEPFTDSHGHPNGTFHRACLPLGRAKGLDKTKAFESLQRDCDKRDGRVMP